MRLKLVGFCAAMALGALTQTASAAQIAVSMAYFDDNWLTIVRNAIADKAQKDGLTTQFEDAKGDTASQLSQLQNFIAEKVDAIIINPVDTSATPKMTQIARAAGIPLVYVSRKPDENELPSKVAYVGSDELISGKLQGEAIAKLMNGKGNLVILEGELATNTAVLRTKDVEDVIAQHPDIKIVRKEVANFQRIPAIDVVNNLLLSGVKIDAIAANNDEMAIGAIMAIQQSGQDPKKMIIGGIDATADALDQMAKGNLSVTVFQNAKGQGTLAVETVEKIIKNETVTSFNWVPFELVTQENYKSYASK